MSRDNLQKLEERDTGSQLTQPPLHNCIRQHKKRIDRVEESGRSRLVKRHARCRDEGGLHRVLIKNQGKDGLVVFRAICNSRESTAKFYCDFKKLQLIGY